MRVVTASESEIDALRVDLVRQSRDDGRSWEEIADALGVARQSAWEFYNVRLLTQVEDRVAKNKDLTEEEARRLAIEEVRSVRRNRRTR